MMGDSLIDTDDKYLMDKTEFDYLASVPDSDKMGQQARMFELDRELAQMKADDMRKNELMKDIQLLGDVEVPEMPNFQDFPEASYRDGEFIPESLPRVISLGQENELLDIAKQSMAKQKEMENLSSLLSSNIISQMSENIPIPSGYDVYWEKWVDAYESDIETIDMTHEKFEEDEKSDFGIDFQSFEEEDAIELPMKTIQTIFTPFGVLPLTEQSLASSYFKFWVGHTNFKITYSFYKIISNIEGVETLDVFSPYRFRISVGKLFRDRDVMNHIRKSMISYAKGQINEYFKEEES